VPVRARCWWTLAALGVAALLAAPRCATAQSCTGDCNVDGMVAINELILGVNIALGSAAVAGCTALDRDGDGSVLISDLIDAVNRALNGCGSGPSPTPSM